MGRTIHIEPVTRIEGHAKITIQLDDAGKVADAKFHVVEFRGFEKFCEGRTYPEMPGITMRICGICPISHMIASAKACDAITGVRIPKAAEKLRRLINYAQYTQSHALSFFHLSAPDLLLGMESDPAARNVIGLIHANPDLARKAVRLRQFGQAIIRMLGTKSVHPPWAVPGGVRDGLKEEDIDWIRKRLPEEIDTVELAIKLLLDSYPSFQREVEVYGNFPSLFVGLVTPEGGLEFYDGLLRVMDADGKLLEKGLANEKWRDIIAEAVEPWSYLKFPYYKPFGYRQENGDIPGLYRVGPLARVNICDFAGTPKADREVRNFRRLGKDGKPVLSSFHTHYARVIEILHSLERIGELIDDPDIRSGHLRSQAGANNEQGVGIMEAPRGTLFHEYHVDETGILKKVSLLVATGNNNLAMNKTIRQIAQSYMDGANITEGLCNRVEHGIRLYDPCLSCSTHAVGQMPMRVQLFDWRGNLVDEKLRG
ncbi:MAG: Ni/Fe hydrogenase subunit alpha [Deltaproteobacteria bacterium]|jgi:NAD-reducing hydrogenase large subunit|nr:Ni/Fe hydrogenase subunit alpha [Deltaproteobacteria bacterium]